MASSQVIIATNDNTDKTDQHLTTYRDEFHGVNILRLDGQMAALTERVERIAMARNATLNALFASDVCYPFTIVMDLDGPNTRLNSDQVLTAFQQEQFSWDGLFANQEGPYYDLYALRCAGWCEEDPWQIVENVSKIPIFRKRRRARLIDRLIYQRQYNVPVTHPPIKVESAFGGLGLYRTTALEGLHYQARDEAGKITCEHVMLHRAMRARGSELYIDPQLLTLSQSEHLGPSSGAPLPRRLNEDDNE